MPTAPLHSDRHYWIDNTAGFRLHIAKGVTQYCYIPTLEAKDQGHFASTAVTARRHSLPFLFLSSSKHDVLEV